MVSTRGSMQGIVYNAPTTYQFAAAHHAGEVKPHQNPAHLRPLQPTQNYTNYAQIRAHPHPHAQKHVPKGIPKRVRFSPTESSAQISILGPAPVRSQKNPRKQAPKGIRKLNVSPSPIKNDPRNPALWTPAVWQSLQAPNCWKTTLKYLMDDVLLDDEDGFSAEFHMKVIAAMTFCDELVAPFSSSSHQS
ncbi:hypothetical protein DFH28DRAFT_1194404 [Melampsora americana]|nr:hypothetical protein DFH28DRAFT_1194404 [Melampsora americana]